MVVNFDKGENMRVNGLRVPLEIEKLINNGIWPLNDEMFLKQEENPLITKNNIKHLISNENCICLYPPVFKTFVEFIGEDEHGVWKNFSLKGLDLSRIVLIGDFGCGSDNFLALNYCEYVNEPTVISTIILPESTAFKTVYGWIKVSNNFREFCNGVGLPIN